MFHIVYLNTLPWFASGIYEEDVCGALYSSEVHLKRTWGIGMPLFVLRESGRPEKLWQRLSA